MKKVLNSLILTKDQEIAACKWTLKEMKLAVKDRFREEYKVYSGICYEIHLYISKDVNLKKRQKNGIHIIDLCPILQQYKPSGKSLTGFWFDMSSNGYKKRVELLEKLLKEHDS